MAMNIILSIVILLFFSPIAFSYEYYTLAQEIPGTICKYQKCASAMMGSIGQSTMNLHGLWPDTANASLRPFNCLENLYDEDQLDPTVKSSMDKNWVGLYNSTFWFRWHEWGKHGTCWEDNSYLGEKNQKTFLSANDQYFVAMNRYLQKALDLKAKVGLDSLIYTDGVAERSFNFEDLNTLILNHIGVEKYYIHCKFLNGVQYLDTIEICLDLSYNYIDCPTSTVACKNTADVVVPQLAI